MKNKLPLALPKYEVPVPTADAAAFFVASTVLVTVSTNYIAIEMNEFTRNTFCCVNEKVPLAVPTYDDPFSTADAVKFLVVSTVLRTVLATESKNNKKSKYTSEHNSNKL